MEQYKLGAMEKKFAQIIWDNAPISSGELVKLCQARLDWKKSTTYTMLRRLCRRGIFVNDGGTVRTLVNREDFYAAQSRQFVNDTFNGSLPSFLTAFTKKQRLSQQEIDEIQALIDSYKE